MLAKKFRLAGDRIVTVTDPVGDLAVLPVSVNNAAAVDAQRLTGHEGAVV